MRLSRFTALLTLAAIVGCSRGSTEPSVPTSIIPGNVTATRVTGGVTVTNGTERPVAYAVWNPNFLGLLATCNDPSPSCVSLQPGAHVTVPYSEMAGWTAQTTAVVVYWWHVLPTDKGYVTSTVGQVPVSLQP